jgi:hypothetical protein
MTRVHFTAMALTTSVLSFGIGFSVSADAKVTGLEITSKQSYGTFKARRIRVLGRPYRR